MAKDITYLGNEMLLEPSNYILHFAIAIIALVLILTLFFELKKPKKDPNKDPDTKRINEILKD